LKSSIGWRWRIKAGGALLAEPVLASLAVEHGARSLQPIGFARFTELAWVDPLVQ
jgi:hypothetical protein